MMKTITPIVTAEARPLVREGIRSLLKGDDSFELVAEAPNQATTLVLLQAYRPQILILDLELAGPSPDQFIQSCQKGSQNLKILLLSHRNDPEDLSGLRACRVQGLIHKPEASQSLMAALRELRSDGHWFRPEVLQRIFSSPPRRPAPQSAQFTAREKDILELIQQGKCNGHIASELKLNISTVRHYASIIYSKLGVKNRVQAVRARPHTR